MLRDATEILAVARAKESLGPVSVVSSTWNSGVWSSMVIQCRYNHKKWHPSIETPWKPRVSGPGALSAACTDGGTNTAAWPCTNWSLANGQPCLGKYPTTWGIFQA